MVDGDQMIPFVRLFYGSLSVYLWDDDKGVTHEIRQGGRRRAGRCHDAHCSTHWGSTKHLRSVQSQLRPSEGLLAFHDDILCCHFS